MANIEQLREQLREKIINAAKASRNGFCRAGGWRGDTKGGIRWFYFGSYQNITHIKNRHNVEALLNYIWEPDEPFHPLELLAQQSEA